MAGMEHVDWLNLHDIYESFCYQISVTTLILENLTVGSDTWNIVLQILVVLYWWRELVKALISNQDFGPSV